MSEAKFLEIEAIKKLKARYFRLLDTREWEAWAEVFHEQATLQWGPEPDQVMVGRAAIVAGVSGALEGASTIHHGHMPEIELLDDTHARGIWAMFDSIDHPKYDLEGFGHYHDEYEKDASGWRIRRTQLTRLREIRIPK